MRDALGAAKHKLGREMDSHSALPNNVIVADHWIVSSLLQKSIRRGETEIAQRAAFTFFKLKGPTIWRRLMVIAFEDVGIGSIDALTMTAAAADDSAWRKNHGGDLRLAAYLTPLLAEAPKDRSADYLCDAKDHPMLTEFWRAMENASLESRLSHVQDQALGLPQRAVAAVSAVGIGSRGHISRGTGGLEALLATFRELEVPEELVAATGIAAARTREKITAMVPLIWLAARKSENQVCDCAVPPLVKAGDVPLYALDMHTRLGREAIWRFACENDSVRTCLARFVPARQTRSAAYVAAFYVDAAPVARRLMWDQSEELEAFGIERDLLHAGVPVEGIEPLLEAMRANLGHLNELRTQVLAGSHMARIAQISPAGAR
jgi:MgsA AAA+ ATPase C terminal